MENLTFINLSEQKVKALISETIKEEFKKLTLPQNDSTKFELLTQKEAANFIGVSIVTLLKLRRENLITPRILGTIIRYNKSDLEEAFSQVIKLKGKGGSNGK